MPKIMLVEPTVKINNVLKLWTNGKIHGTVKGYANVELVALDITIKEVSSFPASMQIVIPWGKVYGMAKRAKKAVKEIEKKGGE